MHFNTLSPELGSAFHSTKEHNDSYSIAKADLPKKEVIKGLGFINKGFFAGVYSDTNSEDAIVYKGAKAEDYTTIWLRKSGYVLVQTTVETKENEIAYLSESGEFTNKGDGLNPVGRFSNDGYKSNDIFVGFLEFDAFAPVLIKKETQGGTPPVETKSKNIDVINPSLKLIFKTLKLLTLVTKGLVANNPQQTKHLESLEKELNSFEQKNENNQSKEEIIN